MVLHFKWSIHISKAESYRIFGTIFFSRRIVDDLLANLSHSGVQVPLIDKIVHIHAQFNHFIYILNFFW